MKKIKNYLNKFDLTEKLIAFFISVPLSHITIKSILLHDTKGSVGNGILYFFISLFLYFFISLYFIEIYVKLMNLFTSKLSKKNVRINKDYFKLISFPSLLLATGFLLIFIISAYQAHLSLLLESDFVTNNSIAREINVNYILPIISIYFIIIAVIQIGYLIKNLKLNIVISLISTSISLLATFVIFFALTKVMTIIYWVILIITGPWVPG